MDNVDHQSIYNGPLDRLDLRTGIGDQTFLSKKGNECYHGGFKRDAYDGYAPYSDYISSTSWAYEGNFYANNFNGYGTISYGDATIFDGLFRKDKPFGPGVLTYPNGYQDVGLWYGSQIYRLCITVGSIEKLSSTRIDRIQVMKYKKLIQIYDDKKQNIATEILRSINKYDELISVASNLYSRLCKNPESYFFDHKFFSSGFDDLKEIEEDLDNKKKKVTSLATDFINIKITKVAEPTNERQVTPLLKKNPNILLLSWNNGDTVIEIMKHTFKHRGQEQVSHYEVGHILCGRRMLFRKRGPKENGSITILNASANNDVDTILKMLNKHTLNVDVMDNKGNSMILRAAANDALDVIELLNVLGANINALNDEGFSALTHTLCRYIAVKYKIEDWAIGFMPTLYNVSPEGSADNEAEESNKWMDKCMKSDESIITSSGGSIQVTKSRIKTARYVFDLNPEPPKPLKKGSGPGGKEEENVELDKKTKERLEIIELTAFFLIQMGIDINCSATPESIMVLAIFSGNIPIVEELLKSGADPNEKLSICNAGLTALHVIAKARPLSSFPAMVKILLESGADPNLRTIENYNIEEWHYLLDDLLDDIKLHHNLKDEGMTPLHIIAVRSDATYVTDKEYLEQVCCLLSWHSDHEQLFMGMNPIGLAISKGNTNIVLTMLNCARMDINAIFSNYWGNPLSTFLRFHAFNDEQSILDILYALILNGADPLETIPLLKGKGNALNMIAQLIDKYDESRKKLSIQSGYGKQASEPREIKAIRFKEHILRKLAKSRLQKYIGGILVRHLLRFLISLNSSLKLQLNLMKTDRLSTEDTSEKYRFNYQQLCNRTGEWMDSIVEFQDYIRRNLEEYGLPYEKVIDIAPIIPKINIQSRLNQSKHLGKKELQKNILDVIASSVEISEKEKISTPKEETLQEITHAANQYNRKFYIYPEVDENNDKYKVCYHCLKQSPTLQLCPKCHLVYFCSRKCNLAHVEKHDNYHKCKKVFWGIKKEVSFSYKQKSKTKLKLLKDRRTIPRTRSQKGISGTRSQKGLSRTRSQKGISRTRSQKELSRTRSHKSVSSFKKVPMTKSNLSLYEKDYSKTRKMSKEKSIISKKKPIMSKTKSIRKSIRKSREEKKKIKKLSLKKTHLLQTAKLKANKVLHKDKKKSNKKFKQKPQKKKKKTQSERSSYKSRSTITSLRKSSIITMGLLERDEREEDEESRASGGRKQGIEQAAKMLEENLASLEETKIEADKKKQALEQVDTDLLGGTVPPEEYWEKETEVKYSLKRRLMAFMWLLYNEYKEYFDIEHYFPYILFIDGKLYYKYYGEPPPFKENYSLN